MFGFVKVDSGLDVIHSFIAERKKSYQYFTGLSPDVVTNLKRKILKKGCDRQAANEMKNKDLLRMVIEPGIVKAKFNRLNAKGHVIKMIEQEKSVTSSFDNSAFYKDCGLCNVPFHSSLESIEHCDSLRCKRNRLLADMWFRLECKKNE